jgi:hypothetical protein
LGSLTAPNPDGYSKLNFEPSSENPFLAPFTLPVTSIHLLIVLIFEGSNQLRKEPVNRPKIGVASSILGASQPAQFKTVETPHY